MNIEAGKLAHCSGPFWPDINHFRSSIAAPFIRAVLSDFISLIRSTSGNGPLVSALCNLVSDRVLEFSTITPSIGHAFRATLTPTQCDPLPIALNLVLELLEEIPGVSFRAEFRAPVSLRVEPVILPEASEIQLTWDPPNLHLVTHSYDALFSVIKGRRRLNGIVPIDCQPLSTFSRIASISVLCDSKRSVFPPLDLHSAEGVDPGSLSNLKIAQELLIGITPEYASWIRPVVRYVVLTKAPWTGFMSGSDRFNPGVVAMSHPMNVLQVAESLVHEAAHQHFFLVDSMTELCDPDHDDLYYSPLRKSNRTLDNILLAYHAAANIVCLYQLLRTRNACYQPDDAALSGAIDDFEILSAHLLNNSALTCAGRLLFEPIYNMIIQNGWTKTPK